MHCKSQMIFLLFLLGVNADYCLFPSTNAVTYNNFNIQNAQYGCLNASIPLASFPNATSFRYHGLSCLSGVITVCGRDLRLASSMTTLIELEMYRSLFKAGLGNEEFWTMSSLNGEYRDAAFVNTVSDLYVFGSATDKSTPRRWLCLKTN